MLSSRRKETTMTTLKTLKASELEAYKHYIEWERSYTWDGSGTPERALVRAAKPNGEGMTYVYVGMPDANDSRTVPSDTEFVVLGEVE
jgi:hypothetical protein